MPNIGDFQVVGLRRFGQLQSVNAEGDWKATVFNDDGDCAFIPLEASVAAANTIVPQAPPAGYAGFGDLVRWTRNTPSGSADEWPGPSCVMTTVLFTHHDESGSDYWVLYWPEKLGFVLAYESEVSLLKSALP